MEQMEKKERPGEIPKPGGMPQPRGVQQPGGLRIGTREWMLALGLLVAVLNYNLLSGMQQLPSPIYGGDYWNHLGTIYHLYYGGSLLENGQMAGEIPWVPWFYHLVIAMVARISAIDPLQTVVWSNLPLILLSTWLLYRILSRFTDNPIAMAAAILPLLMLYPIFKYTDFAFLVVGPALLLAWIKYREDPHRNNLLLLIATMVIANLTSTQMLIADYIVFALIAANAVYHALGKDGKWSQLATRAGRETLMPYAIIFLATLLGSLAYWYAPLFVYHGSTPNDLFIYGWPDFTKFSEQAGFFWAVLSNWFIPDLSWGGAYRLALLAGAVLLVKNRTENKAHETAALFLLGAFIGVSHHFLTFNLFHFHFDPGRPFQMLEMPLSVVELALASMWLQKRAGTKYAALALLLVSALLFSNAYTARQKDPYYVAAMQPLPAPLAELKQWTIAHTDVNDVFLTDNEDAFMLNGLTGRKSVSYRRTHAPIYTDMNQRMLDSAVVFYGSDNATRNTLLKKYHVKYLLWTIQWFKNQYALNAQGQVVGFFDPFMVPVKPEYESYWQNNGVTYLKTTSYLDPAWIPSYPMYHVAVAVPTQGDLFHPWDAGLDPHLQEIKRIDIEDNGQQIPFAIVYEVHYD